MADLQKCAIVLLIPGTGLAHGGASHQELEGDRELASCDRDYRMVRLLRST